MKVNLTKNSTSIQESTYKIPFKRIYTPDELDNYILRCSQNPNVPFQEHLKSFFHNVNELGCCLSKKFLGEMRQVIKESFNNISANAIDFMIDKYIVEEYNPEAVSMLLNSNTPLIRSLLYPEKLKVKTSKLFGVPITQRKVSIGRTPILTISTYDKEERALPADLKELLLEPKTSIKNLIDIIQGVTAQRKILQNKYCISPFNRNEVKLNVTNPNLINIDGLSDMDQILFIKSFIQKSKPSDLIKLPINIFPLPTSFRRFVHIPQDPAAKEFYEFKLPGELVWHGEDKRNIYEGDFYTGIQLLEEGIPKEYLLYTPVAMITIHNIESNPMLVYNNKHISGVYDENGNTRTNSNIIIYKRPDGIRLSEIAGTVNANSINLTKQNYKFINKYLTTTLSRKENLKKIAVDFYKLWGFLNGAIGLANDHIGNYILTKEGKVVSVNDIDRASDYSKINYHLLHNYLEKINFFDEKNIYASIPNLLKKNRIKYPSIEDCNNLSKEYIDKGIQFRTNYLNKIR